MTRILFVMLAMIAVYLGHGIYTSVTRDTPVAQETAQQSAYFKLVHSYVNSVDVLPIDKVASWCKSSNEAACSISLFDASSGNNKSGVVYRGILQGPESRDCVSPNFEVPTDITVVYATENMWFFDSTQGRGPDDPLPGRCNTRFFTMIGYIHFVAENIR